MDMNKITLVRDAKLKYEQALERKMNVTVRREEYINTLVNCADALLEAVDELASMEQEYNEQVAETVRLTQELKAAQEASREKKRG